MSVHQHWYRIKWISFFVSIMGKFGNILFPDLIYSISDVEPFFHIFYCLNKSLRSFFFGSFLRGNTGSQSNGDGVYRRKRKMSLVLGAYRSKYDDYRAQLQKRAGLEDKTMDYLAAYKYGSDLIRKLATMK